MDWKSFGVCTMKLKRWLEVWIVWNYNPKTTVQLYESPFRTLYKLKVISMMQKNGFKEIKIHSPDKLIFGHLNINSVKNKFEALTYIIENNIDLLLISETKLDDSFPTAQFQMKGFSVPYRYDFFCTFTRIYSLNY